MKIIKKGFTLIELLVVMAIFSILLAGAMALVGPVSRMMTNTSVEEKTYSYSNNIQEYLQNTLEYSDSLYIYTSDYIDKKYTPKSYPSGSPAIGNDDGKVNYSELAILAEAFRKEHYNNIVMSHDGANAVPVKGRIYILRLVNNPDANDAGDSKAPQGQITRYVYDFTSNEQIPGDSKPAQELMLNSAYFEASDAVYSFSYALGSSKLVPLDSDPTGGNDTYKAIESDMKGAECGITASNLSVSIVLDKEGSVTDVSASRDDGTSYTYRAFKSPVAVQITNLPLTNINYRSTLNKTTTSYGVRRYVLEDGKPVLQSEADAGTGFEDYINKQIDFDNDIYFVFAYPDELQ